MSRSSRHPAVLALLVVVALESVALAAATAWLAIELVVAAPDSFGTAAALTVTSGVLALGVAWLAVGIARGRRGIRGGILVWQFLQASIGIGALQGAFARPDIGWAILVPAIAGFVLVLTPPVAAALGRGPAGPAEG